MIVEWGPLTGQDAGQWAELVAAIEAEDQTNEHYNADDLAEDLANPLLDLADGTLVGRVDGRMVAFSVLPVKQSAEPTHLMTLWAGVHPEFRGNGLGTHLLQWAIATAPVLHERAYAGKPLELHTFAVESNKAAIALVERTGFEAARWFFDMECPLGEARAAGSAPEGITFATWSPELDEAAMEVRNEAFLDHWASRPQTLEGWTRTITSGTRNFAPESTFLALAGERAVGVLITHHYDADTAVTGVREAWIQIIGTVREWRGKGVASGLIAHALSAFQEQGYAQAGLNVDADNPTGALGVYTRAGFQTTQRTTAYSMPLTPA